MWRVIWTNMAAEKISSTQIDNIILDVSPWFDAVISRRRVTVAVDGELLIVTRCCGCECGRVAMWTVLKRSSGYFQLASGNLQSTGKYRSSTIVTSKLTMATSLTRINVLTLLLVATSLLSSLEHRVWNRRPKSTPTDKAVDWRRSRLSASLIVIQTTNLAAGKTWFTDQKECQHLEHHRWARGSRGGGRPP